MWDMRAKQYFLTEEHYHKGMKLLQEYQEAASRCSSFDELSRTFLDKLDDTTDHESDLLDRASRHYASLKLESFPQHNFLNENILENIYKLFEKRLDSLVCENTSASSNKLLSESFEDFISAHKNSWSISSGQEKSFRQQFFPLFLDVVSDINTSDLKKSHINSFISLLLNYPSNKNKKIEYSYLSTKDFFNIDVPDEDRLSQATLKKYLTSIGMFLRWLKATDHTIIDLDTPLKAVKITSIRASEQRHHFNDDDLVRIFNSVDYIQGKHVSSSRFWVPLIALFTGARLNEICQLSTHDVYFNDEFDVYVFDINNDSKFVPYKSIKRPSHARLVPVHNQLIKLGFLDYLEKVRRVSNQLFPELVYFNDENKYGHAIQKWFKRTYLNSNNCNILDPKKSFHSFRHTVINQFATIHGLNENQIAAGLGQSTKGGVFETRYAKHESFKSYYKHFSKLNFNSCIDFSIIRNWKSHIFSRNPPFK